MAVPNGNNDKDWAIRSEASQIYLEERSETKWKWGNYHGNFLKI
jgi:hypothetical protein